MSKHDLPYPRPPAQVEPYIEALGLEDTLAFLEAFGGSEIYIATNPKSRSSVAAVVGHAKAKALASIAERLQRRVPLAKRWRAQVYYSKGLKKAQIARKLGVTDVTVRAYLGNAPPGDPNQLTLF
ncbi:helix-turn-helix domain-containing protein [Ruegeria sediminis]|uniref:Helix-turn-helix domain-containing protein n=1 Tax=Ruegeria sediminis TaxID=2583820 RepID=A0ABY2X460_9RHOB|nr:helix-turn-helix domain-containing protein [Ruegeria sediminis]TMV09840.1 helix-turn-helix domain-containing protein [Ruegeria sediminis]